jgi:hypothetical protein
MRAGVALRTMNARSTLLDGRAPCMRYNSRKASPGQTLGPHLPHSALLQVSSACATAGVSTAHPCAKAVPSHNASQDIADASGSQHWQPPHKETAGSHHKGSLLPEATTAGGARLASAVSHTLSRIRRLPTPPLLTLFTGWRAALICAKNRVGLPGMSGERKVGFSGRCLRHNALG